MSRELPDWVADFKALPGNITRSELTRIDMDGNAESRPGAVLILLGEGESGPDVLITERAAELRAHAGQPAFPGGAIDATDESPVHAAIREAEEEAGVSRDDLEVLGVLPTLWLPPSNFLVTPVLAWWHTPRYHTEIITEEVARVVRVPLADLVNPANRLRVQHANGFISAAFDVADMRIWGFTGGILDRLLALTGWEVEWDRERILPLP